MQSSERVGEVGSVGNCTRMKELQIDGNGRLILDTMELPENSVIVISGGRAKLADLPPHSNTMIKTHKGIVNRVNWDEGEAF